jgi:hypothetical protein
MLRVLLDAGSPGAGKADLILEAELLEDDGHLDAIGRLGRVQVKVRHFSRCL